MYKKMIFGGVICLLAGVAFDAQVADKAIAPKTEDAKKPESEQVVISNLPDKIKLIIGIGEKKTKRSCLFYNLFKSHIDTFLLHFPSLKKVEGEIIVINII